MRRHKIDPSQGILGLQFPELPIDAAKTSRPQMATGASPLDALPLVPEKDLTESFRNSDLWRLLQLPALESYRLIALREGAVAVVLPASEFERFSTAPLTAHLKEQEKKLSGHGGPDFHDETLRGVQAHALLYVVNFGRGSPHDTSQEYLRAVCEERIAAKSPSHAVDVSLLLTQSPEGERFVPLGFLGEFNLGNRRALLARGGVLCGVEKQVAIPETEEGDPRSLSAVLTVQKIIRAQSGRIKLLLTDGFQVIATSFMGDVPGIKSIQEGQSVLVTGKLIASQNRHAPAPQLAVSSLSPAERITPPVDLWPPRQPTPYRRTWNKITIHTAPEALKRIELLKGSGEIYLDVETSQDPANPNIHTTQLCQFGVRPQGGTSKGSGPSAGGTAYLLPREILLAVHNGVRVLDKLRELLGGDTGPTVWIHYSEFEEARFGELGLKLERVEDTRKWALRLQPYLEGYSLQTLVGWNLNLHLDKQYQKSDWSGERTEEQNDYAVIDVEVLALLADHLRLLEEKALSPLDWVLTLAKAGDSFAERLRVLETKEPPILGSLQLSELFEALNATDEAIFSVDQTRSGAFQRISLAQEAIASRIEELLRIGAPPYEGPFGRARFGGTERVIDIDRLKRQLLSRTKKPEQRAPIDEFLRSAQAFSSGSLAPVVAALTHECESEDLEDASAAHALLSSLPAVLERSRRTTAERNPTYRVTSRAQEIAHARGADIPLPEGGESYEPLVPQTLPELMEQFDRVNSEKLSEILDHSWPLAVLFTRRALLLEEIHTRLAHGERYEGDAGSVTELRAEVYSFAAFEEALDYLETKEGLPGEDVGRLLLFAQSHPWISEDDARHAIYLLHGELEEEQIREILRPCVIQTEIPRHEGPYLRATCTRWEDL